MKAFYIVSVLVCLLVQNIFGACPTWSATASYSQGNQVCYNNVGYEVVSGVYGITGSAYNPTGSYKHFWKTVTTCDCGGTTTTTVTYNGNSNTAGTVPAVSSGTAGRSITLPAQGTLARTGYSFGGWNTLANGSGTNYNAGATYVVNSSVTLYAKWNAAATATVTYNGNSNTAGTVPAVSSGSAGRSITLPAQGTLARTGYTFGGWNTLANGSGTNYNAGATYVVNSSVTLYVKWNAPTTATVTYNGNGNTSGSVPAASTGSIGRIITLAGQGTLARTGYYFEGWNTAADGSGDVLSAGDNYTVSASITLYAQWQYQQIVYFTVSYNGNNNTSGSAPATQDNIIAGSSITLPSQGSLSRAGYTFGGWLTDPMDASSTYSAGAHFTVTSNVTFYAKWDGVMPNGVDHGDMLYWNAYSNQWQMVPLGTEGQVLKVRGGRTPSPAWADTTKLPIGVAMDIDGNVYHTIVIGNQEWTLTNLKSTKLNDGTAIPNVTDNSAWIAMATPGYCWYGNDKTANEKYGALYNWYTINTGMLAPFGWRVPTEDDWWVLENYLTANGYNFDGTTTGSKVAKSMAATVWAASAQTGGIGNNLNSNNKSSFSALPGGMRYEDGNFYLQSSLCRWWSATTFDVPTAHARGLSFDRMELIHFNIPKISGYSVRLVRDLK